MTSWNLPNVFETRCNDVNQTAEHIIYCRAVRYRTQLRYLI